MADSDLAMGLCGQILLWGGEILLLLEGFGARGIGALIVSVLLVSLLVLLEMSKGSTHLVADFIVKGFLSRTLLHLYLTDKVLGLFPFLHSSFGHELPLVWVSFSEPCGQLHVDP